MTLTFISSSCAAPPAAYVGSIALVYLAADPALYPPHVLYHTPSGAAEFGASHAIFSICLPLLCVPISLHAVSRYGSREGPRAWGGVGWRG